MAESKKKAAAPINDVAPADTSAPASTSKPVIITNRPIMRDTMVVHEDGGDEAEQKDEAAPPIKTGGSSKPKLQPLSPPEAPPETAEPDKTSTNQPTETVEDDTVKALVPEEQPGPPEQKSSKPGEAAPADKEAEVAEQSERDRRLQELADSKEFYLPINSVEKRKTKRFVVLGLLLSVLLVIAWADIALDAGLVQLGGLHSLTHFFSN